MMTASELAATYRAPGKHAEHRALQLELRARAQSKEWRQTLKGLDAKERGN